MDQIHYIIILSPIVLIVFNRNGLIRMQYLGVCDVKYLELRRSKQPYSNILDSNVLFTERKSTLLKR